MYLFIWHLRVANAGVAKLYFVLNAQPENSNWNSTVPQFYFPKHIIFILKVSICAVLNLIQKEMS